MRNLRIVSAALTLWIGSAITASAGEPAHSVPGSTLAAMGYGGIRAMSDEQGLAVRGKGSRVVVWGTGFGVKTGKHFAAGWGAGTSTGGAISGGGAFGYAK